MIRDELKKILRGKCVSNEACDAAIDGIVNLIPNKGVSVDIFEDKAQSSSIRLHPLIENGQTKRFIYQPNDFYTRCLDFCKTCINEAKDGEGDRGAWIDCLKEIDEVIEKHTFLRDKTFAYHKEFYDLAFLLDFLAFIDSEDLLKETVEPSKIVRSFLALQKDVNDE